MRQNVVIEVLVAKKKAKTVKSMVKKYDFLEIKGTGYLLLKKSKEHMELLTLSDSYLCLNVKLNYKSLKKSDIRVMEDSIKLFYLNAKNSKIQDSIKKFLKIKE